MDDPRARDAYRCLATESHEARMTGDRNRADELLLRARDRAQRDDVVEAFLAEFLGGAFEAAGDPYEAAKIHRLALEGIRAARGADHLATRAAAARLAHTDHGEWRNEPVAEALARALDEARRTGGDAHGLGVALARAHRDAGDLTQARDAAQATLALGGSAAAHVVLAEASLHDGSLGAARVHLDAAAAAVRDDLELAEVLLAAARLDLAEGRGDEAAARLDRVLVLHEANLRERHPARIVALQLRSGLFRERGAFAQAETLLLAALHLSASGDGPGSTRTVGLWLDLVELELARGHVRRAGACLRSLHLNHEGPSWLNAWLGPSHLALTTRSEALARCVAGAERDAQRAAPDAFAEEARVAAALVGASDGEETLRTLGRAFRQRGPCPASALEGARSRLLYDLWRRAPRDPDLASLVWPLAGVLPARGPDLVPGPWWLAHGRLAEDEQGPYDRRTGFPLFCRRVADGAAMALVPAPEGEPDDACFLVDLRPVTFGQWHRFGCEPDGLTLGLNADAERPVFCAEAREVRRFLARVGAVLPDWRTWHHAVFLAPEDGQTHPLDGLELQDVTLPDVATGGLEVVSEVLDAWDCRVRRATWGRAFALHGLPPVPSQAARATPRFRRLRPIVPFTQRVARALLQGAAPRRERRLGGHIDLRRSC